MMKRTIVTLCGSTRFKEEFMSRQATETFLGKIVLTVGCFGHADGITHTERRKTDLDELHFDKIRMSDEIFVINVGGYVGESTTNEIACAIALGKEINWQEPAAGEKFLQDNSHRLGRIIAERFAS